MHRNAPTYLFRHWCISASLCFANNQVGAEGLTFGKSVFLHQGWPFFAKKRPNILPNCFESQYFFQKLVHFTIFSQFLKGSTLISFQTHQHFSLGKPSILSYICSLSANQYEYSCSFSPFVSEKGRLRRKLKSLICSPEHCSVRSHISDKQSLSEPSNALLRPTKQYTVTNLGELVIFVVHIRVFFELIRTSNSFEL